MAQTGGAGGEDAAGKVAGRQAAGASQTGQQTGQPAGRASSGVAAGGAAGGAAGATSDGAPRGVAKPTLEFEVDDSKEFKLNLSAAVVERVDHYIDFRRGGNRKLVIDRGKVFERAVVRALDREPGFKDYEKGRAGSRAPEGGGGDGS